MARLSSMLELDDKLAGGAAAKAEAAAAEGAAKAKEEALAKAREAACSHECTHLKGTHEAAPDGRTRFAKVVPPRGRGQIC